MALTAIVSNTEAESGILALILRWHVWLASAELVKTFVGLVPLVVCGHFFSSSFLIANVETRCDQILFFTVLVRFGGDTICLLSESCCDEILQLNVYMRCCFVALPKNRDFGATGALSFFRVSCTDGDDRSVLQRLKQDKFYER